MNVEISVAREVTAELVEGLNQLLPQLSSSAASLTEREVSRIVRSDATTLFVAHANTKIVGILTLVTFAIPTGVRAWIEDVVVDANARGLGVGAALTDAALHEAKARSARTVDLTSRPSRAAANELYQKLGFVLRDSNVYRYTLE
ncbi:MAG: GNAT family N-acetyltransferase [Acidobacteriota bacterium]|nr:GNAT family N-acetyltransferase [Acidobacteriota bacterium]MDE3044529.1 GNAT family N-acetyltransferase [Acidobacteriota bacterium]MDE3107189.1 GNAT family N-acetyltransferase [Acidobacteriota bacterium]